MAKQVRTHSATSAIGSLLKAIDKVAEAELGNVTEEQKIEANKIGLDAVKEATAMIGDSNVMTGLEIQDDNIAAYHQAEAEKEEAEALEQQNLLEEQAEIAVMEEQDKEEQEIVTNEAIEEDRI